MLLTLTDKPMTEEAFINFVITRDAGTCQYCGAINPPGSVMEHVIPKMIGGPYQPFNIVFACRPCNRRKGGSVWIPKNLDSITADHPLWRQEVLSRAVPQPPPSMTINSKYPPISYRIDPAVALAIRLLALDLNRQVGEMVQEIFTEYLERHDQEARP